MVDQVTPGDIPVHYHSKVWTHSFSGPTHPKSSQLCLNQMTENTFVLKMVGNGYSPCLSHLLLRVFMSFRKWVGYSMKFDVVWIIVCVS